MHKAGWLLALFLVLQIPLLGGCSAENALPATTTEAAKRRPAFDYPESTTGADGSTISGEERQAVSVVVELVNAYNAKDAARIRAIDWRVKDDSQDELEKKFVHLIAYHLHSLEILSATPEQINARIVYSTEFNTPSETGPLVSWRRAKVALIYQGRWAVLDIIPDALSTYATIQVVEDAAKRYGVRDLRYWKGLVKVSRPPWL